MLVLLLHRRTGRGRCSPSRRTVRCQRTDTRHAPDERTHLRGSATAQQSAPTTDTEHVPDEHMHLCGVVTARGSVQADRASSGRTLMRTHYCISLCGSGSCEHMGSVLVVRQCLLYSSHALETNCDRTASSANDGHSAQKATAVGAGSRCSCFTLRHQLMFVHQCRYSLNCPDKFLKNTCTCEEILTARVLVSPHTDQFRGNTKRVLRTGKCDYRHVTANKPRGMGPTHTTCKEFRSASPPSRALSARTPPTPIHSALGA